MASADAFLSALPALALNVSGFLDPPPPQGLPMFLGSDYIANTTTNGYREKWLLPGACVVEGGGDGIVVGVILLAE